MAEGGASTGGGGAGAAVVKEGKLFKRGEVMMLGVFVGASIQYELFLSRFAPLIA